MKNNLINCNTSVTAQLFIIKENMLKSVTERFLNCNSYKSLLCKEIKWLLQMKCNISYLYKEFIIVMTNAITNIMNNIISNIQKYCNNCNKHTYLFITKRNTLLQKLKTFCNIL